MKKFLLLSIVPLLFSSSVLAQSESEAPKFYFGFGTGINANTGLLGIKGAYRVYKTVLIDGFAGIGSWGGKYGAGLVFNAKNRHAFCPAISIVRATGLKDFEYEPTDNTAAIKKVKMDLNPATLLNVTMQRQWVFKEKNRLVLEFGYAFLLSGGDYKYTTPNYTPSSTDKKVFDLLKPGGISIGLSFYLAL